MARLMIMLLCATSVLAYCTAYRGLRHHEDSHGSQHHHTTPAKHHHPPSKPWHSAKHPHQPHDREHGYSKVKFPAPVPCKDKHQEHQTVPEHPVSYGAQSKAHEPEKAPRVEEKPAGKEDHKGGHRHF